LLHGYNVPCSQAQFHQSTHYLTDLGMGQCVDTVNKAGEFDYSSEFHCGGVAPDAWQQSYPTSSPTPIAPVQYTPIMESNLLYYGGWTQDSIRETSFQYYTFDWTFGSPKDAAVIVNLSSYGAGLLVILNSSVAPAPCNPGVKCYDCSDDWNLSMTRTCTLASIPSFQKYCVEPDDGCNILIAIVENAGEPVTYSVQVSLGEEGNS
jgi:hypothetical protein